MSKPIRVSEKGHKILRELAEQDSKNMTEVLDNLLEAERKRRFFESLNAGYNALKSDSAAWQAELAEREVMNNTLMDGLDKGEVWHPDGSVTRRD